MQFKTRVRRLFVITIHAARTEQARAAPKLAANIQLEFAFATRELPAIASIPTTGTGKPEEGETETDQ